MAASFKYEVHDTRDGVVHVTVSNFRWKASTISFLWLAVWSFGSYRLFILSRDFGFFAFLAALLCAVMAWLGFYAFVQSLLCRTMSLSATELLLRSSFFGIRTRRHFRLSEIVSLGLGQASHSLIPVLKLEVRDESNPRQRNEWIILANWVTKEQVNEFLQALSSRGFVLPGIKLP